MNCYQSPSSQSHVITASTTSAFSITELSLPDESTMLSVTGPVSERRLRENVC